jgi:Ca2+-binding RTX toxin-like protein
VQVVGNYAYVADGGSGLQIIDISNPATPTFKGNYDTSGRAYGVQVVGNYAYVADYQSGLQIIDISNPAAPTLKGNYQTSGNAFDVQIVGNYAYVADYEGGLQILDVSDFTNPSTSTVTLAVSPSSVTEDGTTNLVYTFTRSGVTTNALTVNYTIGGTATNGTDYTSIPTSVTFAANSSTATVTVDPTADTTVESDETVALTLATGTGYTVGTTTAVTGTITNDDTSVTLAVSPSSVTEDGTTNLVYTFTRSGVTTNPLTVNYTIGGTATNGTDYASIPTSVTFAANSATATVTVDPTADTTVESDETVALTLATGTGYTVGTTTAATGTIANDDVTLPSITLAVSPSSVTEDGTTNLVYTFTRSGVTTNPLTVNYTIGGTATNGTDYTSIPTSVTFAANSATATVIVDPTADTTVEPDETVALTLATGTGYTVGTPNTVTGTIANVTLPSITLAVSPSSVTEDGTANLVYTFTRSGVTTNALTVNYTLGGTATLNTDYTRTGTTNTVTFAAGSSTATVIVDPTADTTVESDETVALTLATGTGYTVGTPDAVTGTILNDDLPSITLAVSPSSVTEDGTTNLIYTFTRSGVTSNALTVNYTLGGTATLNTDYTRTGTTNTVTFAANSSTATVTVDPTADTTVESDETVALTLATGTGYTVGTTTAATGTIANDDLPSITLAVSPTSVTEDGTTNLVYTFTRSGVTTNALTVNYTLGGTATLNTDYTRTGTTNTVTFAANSSTATVIVDPTADTTVENNETVALTLAAGTGYTVGTTTAVTGTITNDDTSVPSQLSINDITVVEGQNNNAILTVTVNNPNPQQITVNYTTAPIDATANVDYTSQTGTLTIAPNTSTASISIPILNDNLNEPDEVFTVTLSNPVNATINPDEAIGQVIITDTLQSAITRTLPNNVENLRLIGTNNINGTGNAGDNKITGNSGNNILAGANGNDIYCFNASTLLGSDTIQETTTGGIDTLDFTGTNTAVRVNLGITTVQTAVTNNLKLTFSANNTIENIIGDSGNDRLTGNSLNNTLTGGGGNDQLTGQDGNDSLIGGSGDDLLTGGNGSDNFIFNSSNLGIDAISDFTPGSDKIVLSKAIFTALQSSIGNGLSQPAEFASVDDDDLAATSSAFIVYSTGSGSIYYNQNGSAAGLGSGAEFANLLTVPTLIAADFALIN